MKSNQRSFTMEYFTNLNKLAVEICKREKSIDREVNISEVKRVIRHLSDIIAEEYQLNFGLQTSATLRKSGRRRLKKNKLIN